MSGKPIVRGRIRQAVCRWCFDKVPLAILARDVASMGYLGLDLVDPAEWGILKEHGLICTMTPSHGLEKGLNKRANHAECVAKIKAGIEASAAAGFPNVICFSGNREPGLSDEEGIRNCVAAGKEVAGLAEEKGITICFELLNSKVDHPGYMCDHSAWGAEVVRRVGSERFKLLYDIYHMQVQEGDVIATIHKLAPLIAHYHTAGVPGRHEIDDKQELNYPPIMRAIVETGFTGYVAQEFVPRGDGMNALRDAAAICDV